jgi:uncharacterized paraquat-inducible protein A
VRQGGLGRGRREEEERWEESFYSLTYLPKRDGSFALAVFIFQGHMFLPTLDVNTIGSLPAKYNIERSWDSRRILLCLELIMYTNNL